MHRYFVTGTDTDVGKTRVTAALALALKNARHHADRSSNSCRPASLREFPAMLRAPANSRVCVRSNLRASRKPPIRGRPRLRTGNPRCMRANWSTQSRISVKDWSTEGAGGLMVPLNAREHFGNIAVAGQFRTVLTVGLKLGCVNHALLTAITVPTSRDQACRSRARRALGSDRAELPRRRRAHVAGKGRDSWHSAV